MLNTLPPLQIQIQALASCDFIHFIPVRIHTQLPYHFRLKHGTSIVYIPEEKYLARTLFPFEAFQYHFEAFLYLDVWMIFSSPMERNSESLIFK
jgi:hypothetical protein